MAATVKVAVAGAVTVTLTGWVVIVRADDAAFTVNVAALLVTLPAVLVTTHSYLVPLLAVVVAAVVYVAFVAPTIAVKVLAPGTSSCHLYVSVGLPLAVTVKVAVAGANTVAFTG